MKDFSLNARMTTNTVKSISGVFRRACMLHVTVSMQLNFYKRVAYFERCRIEA